MHPSIIFNTCNTAPSSSTPLVIGGSGFFFYNIGGSGWSWSGLMMYGLVQSTLLLYLYHSFTNSQKPIARVACLSVSSYIDRRPTITAAASDAAGS